MKKTLTEATTVTLPAGTVIEYPDVVSGKLWRANKGEEYWYVDSAGSVDSDSENSYEIDDYRYTTGNYFRTEEEAEAYHDYLLAMGRVRLAILEANGDWKPDFSKEVESKYSIFYDRYEKKWHFFSFIWLQYQGLPYAKSSDIIKTIITTHADDLEIIRKYMSEV